MSEDRVRQALKQAPVPDESGAAERAWALVERAYDSRESVRWTRRHRGLVVALAATTLATAVLLVAVLTPPGQAVVDRFRDAVGREPSQPALVELPAPGRLLVLSPEGAWVVKEDGSKRLLGAYEDASWSPRGLYVIATQGRQLVAVDPESGEPRWSLSRTEPVSDPRWSGGGLDTRIAYRAGDTLHVVAGDGSPDAVVADGVAPLAPAWMPDSHVLAYADAASDVHVVDTDSRRQLWRTGAVKGVRELAFFGNRLAVSTGSRVLVLRRGKEHRSSGCRRAMSCSTRRCCPTAECSTRTTTPRADSTALFRSDCTVAGACRLMPDTRMFEGPGRISNLVTSPDLAWIAAGWPAADQFLFFKSAPAGSARWTRSRTSRVSSRPAAGPGVSDHPRLGATRAVSRVS